jgi:hypothetical protein
VKIVYYCSVFFYIALAIFAFGVVARGMTGREPSLGDIVMLEFFYSLLTGVKTSLKRPIDSPLNKGCSTVEHWKQHLGFVCSSPTL